ncbi:MAG: hypothetical protein AAFR83_24635 [Cyanobacteria bacterium J06629_18]
MNRAAASKSEPVSFAERRMQADSSDGVAKLSTKLSSLLTQKPLWTLCSFPKTLFIS